MTHRNRPVAVILVALFVLHIAGCKTLSHESIDSTFPGVDAAMEKPIVCLLFVHGIGGYSNDDPKHILDAIAKLPNMKQTAASHNLAMTGTAATLVEQDFVDTETDHQLRAYTLTWETVTTPLKAQYLGYDSAKAITDTRLPLNSELRQSLMDGGIPDVILYEGKYKPVIQAAVKVALKRIHDEIETRDDQENDYEYVFVTWSLGSKIVFDCLAEPTEGATRPTTGPSVTAEQYALNMMAAKTHSVFMLANQVPLLTLGDVQSQESAVPYKALRSVAKRRKNAVAAKAVSATPTRPPLSIVAFSDPNDLLSYPIPGGIVPSDEASVANVSISVATTAYCIPFVGWIWNPDTAHTAYGIDDRVVNMILHGAKADGTK